MTSDRKGLGNDRWNPNKHEQQKSDWKFFCYAFSWLHHPFSWLHHPCLCPPTQVLCEFLSCSDFRFRECHVAEFAFAIPFPSLILWSFMYNWALTASRELFMRDCGFWQCFHQGSFFFLIFFVIQSLA